MVRPKSSRSKKASNHSARRVDGREVLNKILLDLPKEEWAVVCAKLEFLDLPTRTMLNEAGLPIKYGYFLNAGLGSILTKAGEGKSVEVGLCGKEGYVGVPLAAGFRSSPARVLMQVAGNGFRVNAKDFGGRFAGMSESRDGVATIWIGDGGAIGAGGRMQSAA